MKSRTRTPNLIMFTVVPNGANIVTIFFVKVMHYLIFLGHNLLLVTDRVPENLDFGLWKCHGGKGLKAS